MADRFLGYWALRLTFAKLVFWSEHSSYNKRSRRRMEWKYMVTSWGWVVPSWVELSLVDVKSSLKLSWNNLLSKKFCGQKSLVKTFISLKNFGSKQIGSQKMLGQKDFGSKKNLLEKFWSKEILCPKYFGSKKLVGQKEFLSKKI